MMFRFYFIICCLLIAHVQCQNDLKDQDQLLGTDNCGLMRTKRSGRVIGGRDSTIDESPWQVSLQRITLGSLLPLPEWRHLCGASIIGKKWLLTAAHCVEGILLAIYPGQLRAVVGTSHWKMAMYQRSTQIVPISEILIHDGWNRDDGTNDIALLRTQYPIDLMAGDGHSIKANSVCLPNGIHNFSGTASLSGWGMITDRGLFSSMLPNQLQKIDVPIIDTEQCRRLFAAGDVNLTDSMICAGSFHNGYCLVIPRLVSDIAGYLMGDKFQGAYSGDSGGALVQMVDGRAVQIGLVSFSLPCKSYQPPDVYTKVSKYVDWIRDTINSNSP